MNKTPRYMYVVGIVLLLLGVMWAVGVFEGSENPGPPPEKVSIVSATSIRDLDFRTSRSGVIDQLGEPSRVNVARKIYAAKDRGDVLYRYSIGIGGRQSDRCRYYRDANWMACFRNNALTLLITERSAPLKTNLTGYGLVKRMLSDIALSQEIASRDWKLSGGTVRYRAQAIIDKGGKCQRSLKGKDVWRLCFFADRLISVSVSRQKRVNPESVDDLIWNGFQVPQERFLGRSVTQENKVNLGALGSRECLSYQTESSRNSLDYWMLCFQGKGLSSKERLAKKGQPRLVIRR